MRRGVSNPRKWRYTWEAQSHLPILKLFLFNPIINPYTHCKSLNSQLILQNSVLRTSWYESQPESETFVDVPIPRVLLDGEAPLRCKALDDHIEVRVVLLLPVDHPIFVEFKVVGNGESASSPLFIDTGLKDLCSETAGVRFYCRNCSFQLTRPIKSFAEMPSTNWTEVADNWFGGCCCSFGGVGDKLVAKYANSYVFAAGTCLLGTTFIVLFKDDFIDCNFPCGDGSKGDDVVRYIRNAKSFEEVIPDGGLKHEIVACCDSLKEDTISCDDYREAGLAECHRQRPDKVTNGENLCNMSTASELSNDVWSASECCGGGANKLTCITEKECFKTSGTLEDQPLIKTFELAENQKSFLNGFLGDIFMATSANLSQDVRWVELLCPQCSSFLGAYPADNGFTMLDGGVRLFKSYISTGFPTGGSNDLFRKYTLERMFANQLVENAKMELSYRTVIRDLQTKSAMLQIVLLNPNSFVQGGYSSNMESKSEVVEKVDLSSAIKVLFADCCGNDVSRIRRVEEWVAKNEVDEVYMFSCQIKELIKILDSAKDMFPLSCTSLQGLSLSFMRR